LSYLSVICSHDEIDEEDPYGYNPLLYCLMKDDFDMCSKLIFRGANVNHIYNSHGGKTAIILMVQSKREDAIKFLLDKMANPHICFSQDNLDACDFAKSLGLDKRFFVFYKCNGEHKVKADNT
jgi:ankyrin repeat protein